MSQRSHWCWEIPLALGFLLFHKVRAEFAMGSGPDVYPRIGNVDQSLTCHSRVLGIALTNMGEVVSIGKACFAPPNAIAYADAMAGHRFAMLEMAALQGAFAGLHS
jgi:hypothetical protein